MLLELFFTFMKIGMFTFGGGYAMISVVENACVEDKHWITHDDMMNITVIAESTPGSDHLPGCEISGQLSGDQLDRTRL